MNCRFLASFSLRENEIQFVHQRPKTFAESFVDWAEDVVGFEIRLQKQEFMPGSRLITGSFITALCQISTAPAIRALARCVCSQACANSRACGMS